MALHPCRECGREVSSEAASCPHCGVKAPVPPLPVPDIGKKWMIGVPLVLLTIALLARACGGSDAGSYTPSSSPAPPSRPDLTAAVLFMDGQFTVRNLDSYGWTNCLLTVNGDYSYTLGRIPPAKGATVGAMQLTDDDGKRFNPFAVAPKNADLRCETGGERRYYHAEWK